MMPPPMTSSFFGIERSSSAPVESTMRGSSGRRGSFAACEPAAMIALWKRMVFPPTSMRFRSRNVPTPCTTWTLRTFAMPASPPVSLPTTLSLNARSLARSSFGSPNAIPCEASALAPSTIAAVCSSAFDGMQPTLRQTPPRVG
jgi:hypothetical protein